MSKSRQLCATRPSDTRRRRTCMPVLRQGVGALGVPMKYKEPRVTDEHGVKWFVRAGDPGRKAVTKLKGLGFTQVVLTRALLRGTIKRAGVAHATDPQDVRLYDCEMALDREGFYAVH